MRIGILSSSSRIYSTRRLKEAAKARGHTVRVLDYLKFTILVDEVGPRLVAGEKDIPRVDAVIPRIGASATVFGTAVVRQFEQMGIYTLNGSQAITIARDKLRTMQVLNRLKIRIPPSACVHSKEAIYPAIARVGGDPVIIKLLQGTQGVGVILAESGKSAEAIIETLQVAQQNVLIQKFVSESRGRDIRAFVVGNQVVAAMRRTAQGDEFRSNVHRGGLTERVILPPSYQNIAVRAARMIGLNVAGVDILEGHDGPRVMEVNSSPGLEGIEEATGVDVAARIIEFLEEQVIFPHFDIGERLALTSDHTIVEIEVTRRSGLARKSLGELALSEKGIQTLCIIRTGRGIPNPSAAEEIRTGDKLLCYGDKVALRSIIPQKPRQAARLPVNPVPEES